MKQPLCLQPNGWMLVLFALLAVFFSCVSAPSHPSRPTTPTSTTTSTSITIDNKSPFEVYLIKTEGHSNKIKDADNEDADDNVLFIPPDSHKEYSVDKDYIDKDDVEKSAFVPIYHVKVDEEVDIALEVADRSRPIFLANNRLTIPSIVNNESMGEFQKAERAWVVIRNRSDSNNMELRSGGTESIKPYKNKDDTKKESAVISAGSSEAFAFSDADSLNDLHKYTLKMQDGRDEFAMPQVDIEGKHIYQFTFDGREILLTNSRYLTQLPGATWRYDLHGGEGRSGLQINSIIPRFANDRKSSYYAAGSISGKTGEFTFAYLTEMDNEGNAVWEETYPSWETEEWDASPGDYPSQAVFSDLGYDKDGSLVAVGRRSDWVDEWGKFAHKGWLVKFQESSSIQSGGLLVEKDTLFDCDQLTSISISEDGKGFIAGQHNGEPVIYHYASEYFMKHRADAFPNYPLSTGIGGKISDILSMGGNAFIVIFADGKVGTLYHGNDKFGLKEIRRFGWVPSAMVHIPYGEGKDDEIWVLGTSFSDGMHGITEPFTVQNNQITAHPSEYLLGESGTSFASGYYDISHKDIILGGSKDSMSALFVLNNQDKDIKPLEIENPAKTSINAVIKGNRFGTISLAASDSGNNGFILQSGPRGETYSTHSKGSLPNDPVAISFDDTLPPQIDFDLIEVGIDENDLVEVQLRIHSSSDGKPWKLGQNGRAMIRYNHGGEERVTYQPGKKLSLNETTYNLEVTFLNRYNLSNDSIYKEYKPDVPDGDYGAFVWIDGGEFHLNNKLKISRFKAAVEELSWKDWKDVYKWATQEREGDKYMFTTRGASHNNQDDYPVTSITWLDAVIWCNAASEKNNKTPVYYDDNGNVLTTSQNSTYIPRVDWGADGYRLPTETEWIYMAVQGNYYDYRIKPFKTRYSNGPQPVDAAEYQDRWGIFNLWGNVAEYCWDQNPNDSYLPTGPDYRGESGRYRVVRGYHFGSGSLQYSNNGREDIKAKREIVRSDYKNSRVGFRPIRFPRADKALEKELENYAAVFMLPVEYEGNDGFGVFHLSRTEISWEQWKSVYDWGVENGYGWEIRSGFPPGQAGSQNDVSQSDLPATMISWHDAILWCNAKSEMTGLTPVYKNSFGHTIRSFSDITDVVHQENATGYRLPTWKEWKMAAGHYRYSGSNTLEDVTYTARNTRDFDYQTFTVWPNKLSQDRPQGLRMPKNEKGFYQMSGNVREWCFDSHGNTRIISGGHAASTSNKEFRVDVQMPQKPEKRNAYTGFRVARD